MLAPEFVGLDLDVAERALGLPPRQMELYVGLGYHLLPFQAFDDSGHIKDPMEVPERWKEAYLGAQGLPDWQEIRRQLNLLDKVDYRCYAVGIDYVRDGFRVMPSKRLDSATPATAAFWMDAYDQGPASRIVEVGGKRPLIPPEWAAALRAVLALFSGGGSGGGGEPDPTSGPPQKPPTKPPGKDPKDPEAIQASFAVGALLGLVEALMSFPVNKHVRTTTLWYRAPSPTFPKPMTYEEVKAWQVLGPVMRKGGWLNNERGMANIIWDPIDPGTLWWWDQPSLELEVLPNGPDDSSQTDPKEPKEPKEPIPRPPKPTMPPWATWGSDFPRQPPQFCRALYQLKNCNGTWRGDLTDNLRWSR